MRSRTIIFLGLYIFVLFYTSVIRANINTLMYSIIEFLCMFIIVYILVEIFSLEEFLGIIKTLIIILCIQGVVEFLVGRSLFSYFETIPGLYTGGMIRSGTYRIMGPNNHSLAYGLLLITALPLACIDTTSRRISFWANKYLILGIAINIVLTGSRSTLAVSGLEVILLIIFSDKKNRLEAMRIFLIATLLIILIIVLDPSGSGKYILLQFSSVIDELLGTDFAIRFGADITTLSNSSIYRSLLPSIFTLEWLNPLVGRGSNFKLTLFIQGYYIKSIDNFYIAQYIRFAYPGLVTYSLYILSNLRFMFMLKDPENKYIIRAMIVGTFCYFLNLWWLDTLQTIKYVYILFAIYMSLEYRKKSNI